MLLCPRCRREAQPTGKEWKYRFYKVIEHYCQQCKKRFNGYYRDNELKYTIPKSTK